MNKQIDAQNHVHAARSENGKLCLHYRDVKGKKVGTCNLCGNVSKLTWDHVPPQGGIALAPVEIDRVVSKFNSSFSSSRPVSSRDGLRFRTLCRDCNSLLSKYDCVLNRFAIEVGEYLSSILVLPSQIRVETQPTAIVRAVLGHLLAARLHPVDKFFDALAREVVLDSEMAIPEEISVLYWVFPYFEQTVLRDAMIPLRRGSFSEMQQFGVLKYFPIAYMVTNARQYEGLSSLTTWRNEPVNTHVDLPIDLKFSKGPDWPEGPDDGNFVLVGADGLESLRAVPTSQLVRARRRQR